MVFFFGVVRVRRVQAQSASDAGTPSRCRESWDVMRMCTRGERSVAGESLEKLLRTQVRTHARAQLARVTPRLKKIVVH